MADEYDRAQDLEEKDRDIAIQQHQGRPQPEPRDECADCDDPLPEHRRPFGTCITCQTTRENRARHYRKD